MKIKNSKDGLKLGLMVPVALAAILLFSIIRAVQTAKFIDSETGFFIGGDGLNMIFYVLITLVCLFILAVSFFSSESKKINLADYSDKNAGVAAALFAVALLYDWLDSFFEGSMILNGLPVDAFYRKADAFKALMSTGALPYLLQSVFALLSAFYIILLAKGFFKGNASAYKHKYLAITPVAWAGFKMITRFVKQISYIRVSDLFLELIMLGFMLLFFVALAQVMSGVYSDDSRWRVPALGFGTGILALLLNVPRFIFTLVSKGLVNAEYPFNLADAFCGIFAVFVALAAVKSVKASAAEK